MSSIKYKILSMQVTKSDITSENYEIEGSMQISNSFGFKVNVDNCLLLCNHELSLKKDNKVFADCHYGIEFSIKDFFGNVINEYSPEIFEKRMWDLFNQIVEIIEEKHINEISVWIFLM